MFTYCTYGEEMFHVDNASDVRDGFSEHYIFCGKQAGVNSRVINFVSAGSCFQ